MAEKLLVPNGQKPPVGYTETGRTTVCYGWTYIEVELTYEDVHDIHISERTPPGYEDITEGVKHGLPYKRVGKRIK